MPRTDPHRDWRLGFRKVMSPRIEVAREVSHKLSNLRVNRAGRSIGSCVHRAEPPDAFPESVTFGPSRRVPEGF
jgi:hypothetical protein